MNCNFAQLESLELLKMSEISKNEKWSTASDSLPEGNAKIKLVSAMGNEVVDVSRIVSKLSAILEIKKEVTGPSGTDPPVNQCFGTKTKILDNKDMFFEFENLG